MKRLSLMLLLASVSTAGLSLATLEAHKAQAATTGTLPQVAQARTQAVAHAASAFLASLGTEQRQKAQFAFSPQKSAIAAHFARTGGPGGPGGEPATGPGGKPPRQGPPGGGPDGTRGPGMGAMPGFVGEQYGQAVWSNYPVSDVPRPGVRLGTLTAAQRGAAMHLLQTVLSPAGYRKVQEIMGSDQALTDQGQPFASGKAVYTLAIFGQPSATAPWMIQFGGHHLGLNIVIDGPHGTMTPTLTGAQPAIYKEGGRTVRALAAENDKAFALLDALDTGQRKQAILTYAIGDLVSGPGHMGETIVPEGLKVSAMNARQKALLLDVIAQWAGIIDPAYAKPRMAEIAAGLNDTWFAWSGPTTHKPGHNGSAYYRIQGPKLLIEFSPQGVGGDATMHVHTMYRDPTNDYGVAYTTR